MSEPQAPPHLFTFLTREEFKLCFAVAFVSYTDVFSDVYPIARYATPGHEPADHTWEELIKQAIRYLGLECGYRFQALTPYDDGRITAQVQIEPRNAAFQRIFEWGSLPDVEDALRVAVRMQGDGLVKIPQEPLRDALAIVRGHLETVRRQVNPEAMAEVVKMRRRALDELVEAGLSKEAVN